MFYLESSRYQSCSHKRYELEISEAATRARCRLCSSLKRQPDQLIALPFADFGHVSGDDDERVVERDEADEDADVLIPVGEVVAIL